MSHNHLSSLDTHRLPPESEPEEIPLEVPPLDPSPEQPDPIPHQNPL